MSPKTTFKKGALVGEYRPDATSITFIVTLHGDTDGWELQDLLQSAVDDQYHGIAGFELHKAE